MGMMAQARSARRHDLANMYATIPPMRTSDSMVKRKTCVTVGGDVEEEGWGYGGWGGGGRRPG